MRTEDAAGVLPFRRELTRLKREGSALLVVGETTPEAHRSLCRQMLDRETTARRVLVDTGADRVLGVDRPVASADASEDVHIRYHAETRSACAATPSAAATATASAPTPDAAASSAVPDVRHAASLAELGDRLSTAIDEARRDATEPAQIRVCVDSVLPIVVHADEERLFRLLHPVTASVRAARAMAHVHLPVGRSDRLAKLYGPLFDAVVELRRRDGLVEQRWQLTDSGVTSEWLPVTRP